MPHVGDPLVGPCRSVGRWLARYADAVLVFLLAAVSAIAIGRLQSTQEMWLLLPSVGSIVVLALIVCVPRWVQFADGAAKFLVDHSSAIVTAASVAAATSAITFSLVAGLASPERGPAKVGVGQFLDLIQAPVGSALYTVGMAVGVILITFAVAGLPSCWLRVRRLLAVYGVIGGIGVTVLFGWAVTQSAVLSLGGFFPVPEATLQASPFTTNEIAYLNAAHAAGLLGPWDMVVSRAGVDIDGDRLVDAGWDEAVWVDHYSRALSFGQLACARDAAGSTTLHAITRSHLCGGGSHGDDS